MPTFIDKAMELLSIIENPNTRDVLRVQRKLKCSERWVWEAKARLKKQRAYEVKRFSLLKKLSSGLKFYRSLLFSLSEKPRRLTPTEIREVNDIEIWYDMAEKEVGEVDLVDLERELKEVGLPG